MYAHGLTAQGWRFGWDNARRRFGCCNITDKRITLSKHLTMLNDEERVLRTILHEIAHALTPTHRGHGPEWLAKCAEIGLENPTRCFSAANTETVKPPYVAICPGCLKEHRAFRPGRQRKSCGRCSNRFDPRFELFWRKEVHARRR
jgi:predicted SprT family Zn-dependent metalloprotease